MSLIDKVSDTLIRFNLSETAQSVKQVIATIKRLRNTNDINIAMSTKKVNKYDIISRCIKVIEDRTPK